MSESRRLPQGRLARLTQMATLGARAGASMLVDESREGTAARVADALGGMRGLAAKVGQIASYVDGLVPEGNRDVFQGALAKLRDAAPASPFTDVRRIVEEDLGAPLDRLFDAFEEAPFASASIGQVHRARHGDVDVAVKVQHHGIARAIESDLASAAMLEPLAGLAGGGKVSSKQVFEEMRARLREELDYGLEAERQRAFAALFAGDPMVRVPAVFSERSAARVLTTELVRGDSFEDVQTSDEGARRAWAETLWRFVFKGNLVGGMFNADPHPGNYVFHDAGVVSFLDFGCVEPLPADRRERALGLHRAALDGDEAAFSRFAAQLLDTRGGRWEELAVGYSRRCFEPLFASPYRITRPFAASLVTHFKDLTREIRALPKGERVSIPKGMVFMNRLQFGFYSVLARLDVEVDFRAVERRFLAEAGM